MNISPIAIQPISSLVFPQSISKSNIETELYQNALKNNSPVFSGTVSAISNGVLINFNLKKDSANLVPLGYLDEGRITLFVSEKGIVYAKIDGKKSVAVGAMGSILDHLNYNDELVSALTKNSPSYFNQDLTLGITPEYLDQTNSNTSFSIMSFSARNGVFKGYVKPCLRKYNVLVYQCLTLNQSEPSYLVIDKKNNLNLYFKNILDLEMSKIGKSYKLSSSVIETKPTHTPYIPML